MAGVPQIYNPIHKGVLNKINKARSIAQNISDVSMRTKEYISKVTLPTSFFPVSDEAREFFSNIIYLLLQDYPLLEYTVLDAARQISPYNKFKLVDVPEAGYYYDNELPRSEPWLYGKSVAQDYYNDEAATKDAFTENI
ncbi:hypothetical protein K502DRAFT_353836 [Neoconidiobolus thromboides FSU 785]|nr:hypothetical protein K502DRAFT_353836 [Neoconidiobolus thromboides FSU 785]